MNNFLFNSMPKTYKTEGIVLKHRDFGEADRLVTVFTKSRGKVVALAKGVRKISSRRAASLEPASQAVIFFTQGKTFDLITQTQLITSFFSGYSSLSRLTQINQILEIVDVLTCQQQPDAGVWAILVNTLRSLSLPGAQRRRLIAAAGGILDSLGFGLPDRLTEVTLKDHLESIAGRPLNSKKMLAAL